MEKRYSEDQAMPKMPKQTTPTVFHLSTPSPSPLFAPGDAALAAMRERVVGSSSCSNRFPCARSATPAGASRIFGKGSSGCKGGVPTGKSSMKVPVYSDTTGSDGKEVVPPGSMLQDYCDDHATSVRESSIFSNLCEGTYLS